MAARMRMQGYPAAAWATLTPYCAGWWLLGWEYKGILQQPGLPSLYIVQADGCWYENTRVSRSSLSYPHSLLCRLMAAGMRIQGYPAAAWATLTPYCAGWWLLGWEYKGILQQPGLPSLHFRQKGRKPNSYREVLIALVKVQQIVFQNQIF